MVPLSLSTIVYRAKLSLVIEEFGMATLKKKRTRSIKRDPNQVLITKPVTALQTDGPISAISSSAGRVNSVNQKRYFMVSNNN